MKEKKTRSLLLFLLYILPKNGISRITGIVASLRLPDMLLTPFLKWFIRYYNVNTEEMERGIKDYSSINDFFTRKLKPGVRPIAAGPRQIVSPVDARVSQFGKITDRKLIQAKGIDYSADDLLAFPEFSKQFHDGSFITLYLSPPDYHRIHSPCEGNILGYSYAPGKLFPVHEVAVNGVKELFARNERLTTIISSKHGLFAVIKVGAINVGKIRLAYDSTTTNGWFRRARTLRFQKDIPVGRGDEIGRFEMGSTVIILAEKGALQFPAEICEGKKIRVGEVLGTSLQS